MPGEPMLTPPIRAIAAERFGLAPDATAASVRSALLRQVAAAGFVPEPADHEAALVLAGRNVSPAHHLTALRLERHRAAVEAFAAGFFALPPATPASHLARLAPRGRGLADPSGSIAATGVGAGRQPGRN